MVMRTLTIWERIVLHLARYNLRNPLEYNTTWDLTQDGIASSLRITRAHVSIELKKLKNQGKVEEMYTHVSGGKSKRKAYCLTPLGMSEAERIKDFVEETGIDFMPLLDMKRCDPNALLDSLDDLSKSVLGLACVLRYSVKRDTLPETKQPVIPVDVNGDTVVSDNLKNRVLSAIDEERLSEIHSTAADYWLTVEPDRQERLYHLMKAGRIRDACRLLIKDKDDFLDSMSEDFWHIVSGLEDFPEKYSIDILTMKIATALEFGDNDSAKEAAERLSAIDKEKGMLFISDVELSKGNVDGAIAILESNKDCSDRVEWDLRMAGCLAALARYDEAKKLLENTQKDINRTGNLSRLNDVYLLLSTVLIRMGRPDEAIKQLNKASSGAGKRDLKKIELKLGEAHIAKGLADRE